jgi:TPR repeat protein
MAGLLWAWPRVRSALSELARWEKWRRLHTLQGQIDPATAPVLTVVLLARASEAVGDAAGAEQLLRRAAAARPDEVVLLDTLGKLLERQGPARRGEAIECYRAARAVRPRLGVSLAQALGQAGRGAEGEAVLRDLLRQQPNNPELHFSLGYALWGLNKPDEAVAAFRKAADQGHPPAQYDLGWRYANGRGVAQDYVEAVRWYRKEADQGHPPAQNNLGVMYTNGWGGPRNHLEAVRWFRKAADQGHLLAQSNLGWMYATGQGVAKDDTEAFRWYRKAAEGGDARGQTELAGMYGPPRRRKAPAPGSARTSCCRRSARAAWASSTWPSKRSRSGAASP